MNRKTKRNVIVVAVVAAFAVVAAVSGFATRAVASSAQQPSPFSLLSSAQAGPVSRLGASNSATLVRFASSAPSGSAAAEQILTAAHALASGVGGHAAYLIPSQTGDLCFFVEQIGEACGPPLTPADPLRIGTFDRDSQDDVGPIVFGYAGDGVSSVTFAVGGAVQTVAVRDNVFEFTEPASVASSAVTNVTATLVNGHTTRIG